MKECTNHKGRPVTWQNEVGLKVLYEPPKHRETETTVDIVAIHGLGAHPENTWCKNFDFNTTVNWLQDGGMLPSVVPNARILRFGYIDGIGNGQKDQMSPVHRWVTTTAKLLLSNLRSKRKGLPFRPLVFIAHCSGGLIILKTLLEAQKSKDEWPGIFEYTAGLVFLGTPFRGANNMKHSEMLEALEKYQNVQNEGAQQGPAYFQDVLDGSNKIDSRVESANNFLRDFVGTFCATRSQTHEIQIACFYELVPTELETRSNTHTQMKLIVSKSSGCLDSSEAVEKYAFPRRHFEMNQFCNPMEEDFLILSNVIRRMAEIAPGLVNPQPHHKATRKHQVPFNLRDFPSTQRFIGRDIEMQKIEDYLLNNRPNQDQLNTTCMNSEATNGRVFVAYGPAGVGKTQLAIEFAQRHHQRYDAIFLLDGSSKYSLQHSFINVAWKLPEEELAAEVVEELDKQEINPATVVSGVKQWLSLTSNRHWLLIFDGVDREYSYKERPQYLQAYDVRDFFPEADQGSIIITTRLAGLNRYGIGSKLSYLESRSPPAMAILESNAEKPIQGSPEASSLLYRLQGIPQALSLSGAYLRETNVTLSDFIRLHDSASGAFMLDRDIVSSEEYSQRPIFSTWKMSYEQAILQSKEAAGVLKLWAFLNPKDMCYELIQVVNAAHLLSLLGVETPHWLLRVAGDRREFRRAIRTLSNYSLIDPSDGMSTYSMHPTLHKWTSTLSMGHEKDQLTLLAVGIVAIAYRSESPLSRGWISPHGRYLLDHWGLYQHYWERPQPGTQAKLLDVRSSLDRGIQFNHEGRWEVLADLLDRVEDWKPYRPDRFGEMLLHGRLVVKFNVDWTSTRKYFVYVFEQILLLVDEKNQPVQRKSFFRRHFRKEEEMAPKSRMKHPKLQLRDRVFTKDIVNVIDASGIKTYSIRIFYQSDVAGEQDFIMEFASREEAKTWFDIFFYSFVLPNRRDDQSSYGMN